MYVPPRNPPDLAPTDFPSLDFGLLQTIPNCPTACEAYDVNGIFGFSFGFGLQAQFSSEHSEITHPTLRARSVYL